MAGRDHIKKRDARRALTLLEVIISIALIVMLLSAMLTFYWQTLTIRDQAAQAADRTQIARHVLTGIARELRGCLGVDQIGFPVEQRLVGDRRRITFLTTALPAKHQFEFFEEFDTLPPAQHDLVEVGYWLQVDDEETTEDGDPIVSGILRTAKITLNQFLIDETDPLDLRTDLWSPELLYLEFRYFDGVEWTTTWDVTAGNSLPQLIQITVGFKPLTMYEYEDQDLDEYPIDEYPLGDDQYHADRYTTLVRIPAADKFFASRLQRVGRQLTEQLGVGAEGF